MSMMFDNFSSVCSLDDLIYEVEPLDAMKDIDQNNDDGSNDFLELYRKSYQEALASQQVVEAAENE